MGRIPCCEKDNVKKGQWTPEEDNKLASYISKHGTRNWRLIPKNAGLQRCGKSCRLRWTNYLRPDLKHGEFSDMEEETIVKLHSVVGNRWALIAGQLPGRTDNDVKNHWNTKLKKKLSGMGIDPITHKPFSHLMAEIATTLQPPQITHLADAALGCFKDEMLHLLAKKHADHLPSATAYRGGTSSGDVKKEETVQKIKMAAGPSNDSTKNSKVEKPWDHAMSSLSALPSSGGGCGDEDDEGLCKDYRAMVDGFPYDELSYGFDGFGSTEENESGKDERKGADGTVLNSSDAVFWDLSDDLMNSF